MASKDDTLETKTFEQKFRDFSHSIQFFRDCLTDSQNIIRPLQDVYKDDFNSEIAHAFISKKESQEFHEFASKKATVLVVGQTNSGKSSLINELLGARYLPTAEVPCTSRIVRVRYSTENYLEVCGPSGECLKARRTFKKKNIPRTDIALDDTKRTDKEWVRCVVEVGLKNSLLQGGHLEFVDAPGMSENEALDGIVQECLHGILQVVIYVIDGHSSLRAQDREFLYSLKQKIGSIPIFFLCNKVDMDERAAEFDRDSDDGDDDLDDDGQWKKVEEKKRLAFNALVRSGLIDKETRMDTCDFFHGISTLEVRRARREKLSNRYTDAFEKMKSSFLTFVTVNINSHLRNAACNLTRVQRRIFDYYISRDPKRGHLDAIRRDIETIKTREESYFQKMRTYIKSNLPKLESIITNTVSKCRADILKEAETMEFAPIRIGDIVHRNEIINQCRTQIQKMVLLSVLNASLRMATSTVKTVTDSIKQNLQRSMLEAAKHDGIVGKLLEQQLRTSYFGHLNAKAMVNLTPGVQDFSLMNVWYQTRDEAKRFVDDVVSIVRGTNVNKQWKRRIAINVLDNIDVQKVSYRIIGTMLDDLHSNHETFLVNLRCIDKLSEVADKQSEKQQLVVSKNANAFAETACRTEALIESLLASRPEIQLLGETGRRGKRGIVYNCQVSGRFGDVVAKQLRQSAASESNLHYIAIQHCLTRLDEDHPRVVRPLTMVLVDFKVTLLLPRCTADLSIALTEETFMSTLPLGDRLWILKHITDACIYCRERGLQLIDPRITNVRLDENYCGKLDVCKARDDSIPYPDGLAPFHVRMAPPPLVHSSPKILQLAAEHDVYSLGIMGWLLAVGKYIRPNYAKTDDVSDIYKAVARGTQPDIGRLAEEGVDTPYHGIILDCLTGGLSLWDLATKLDVLFQKKITLH